jgi:hypothetical protein
VRVWAKDRDAGDGGREGGVGMAIVMGKVKMELTKAGWAMMPKALAGKTMEKMSLGELLYWAMLGDGAAV